MNISRINIFGILISKINLREATLFLSQYNYANTNYICLPDLYVLTAAQKDKILAYILNHSLLTLPDGKSIEFIGRIKGEKNFTSVSGYWLVKELLKSNLKHYFYGGILKTNGILADKLKNEFPSSIIVGISSPPLVNLDQIESNSAILKDFEKINQLKPDIIWVGISSPKQDYLVYHYYKLLDHGILIAVGGVFDYLSGSKKISPEWVKTIGFRWLYRLAQEPKRLWRKYLFAFLRFATLILKELFNRYIKGSNRIN
jgi:N-acetylglucosaminyldiphosphoundecaprenol N-acetyl-beta-D-mannosaminyltransferase